MRVAAVQMLSTQDPEHNLSRANDLLQQACSQGIDLALFPETFLFYGSKKKPSLSEQRELIVHISKLAKDNRVWIVAGTLPLNYEVLKPYSAVKTDKDESGKPFAACLVFDSEGSVQGIYSKIHLFDVDVEDNTKAYRESDEYRAGESVAVVKTPWCKLGLSICYDLRFPELYTELSRQGADLIVVPAAFTEVTGQAHWEVLCRARAIETQCFVLAANQGGKHHNGRTTWGESMLVNPWGKVVSKLGKGESVLVESLEFSCLEKIRCDMPIQQHRQLHTGEKAG